jgi:hypothetical protein
MIAPFLLIGIAVQSRGVYIWWKTLGTTIAIASKAKLESQSFAFACLLNVLRDATAIVSRNTVSVAIGEICVFQGAVTKFFNINGAVGTAVQQIAKIPYLDVASKIVG